MQRYAHAAHQPLVEHPLVPLLQVKATLKYGDLLQPPDMVSSTAFDRDDEYFATAGVSRRIKARVVTCTPVTSAYGRVAHRLPAGYIKPCIRVTLSCLCVPNAFPRLESTGAQHFVIPRLPLGHSNTSCRELCLPWRRQDPTLRRRCLERAFEDLPRFLALLQHHRADPPLRLFAAGVRLRQCA